MLEGMSTATVGRSRWPWLVAGFSAAITAASAPLAVRSWRALGSDDVLLLDAIIGVAFPIAGAIILSRLPRHRVGWVMLSAAGLSLAFASQQWANDSLRVRPGSLPAGAWAAWLAEWAWVPFLALPTLLVLWFPTGKPPSPRWRRLQWVIIASIATTTLLSVLQPELGRHAVANPLGLRLPAALTTVRDLLTVVTVALGGLLCVVSAAFRYRASGMEERLQLRWFAVAAALVLVTNIVVNPFVSGFAADLVLALALSLVPAAIGAAILRHRLYGFDLFVNRSVVYAALSILTAVLYVLVVAVTVRVLPGVSLLVGTLAVAIAFAPLRETIQRLVNRTLYGDRLDPYGAVTRLSQRLEGALTDDEALVAAVEDVRQALRVPFAEMVTGEAPNEHRVAAGRRPAAETGHAIAPLAFHGIPVGTLRVAPRGPEDEFTERDRHLLGELGRQLGPAVRAARLTAELQQSREHLVTMREEERRRLHRDLHDGLGPVLASVVLGLDGVRHEVPAELTSAHHLLELLKADLKGAVADVRRLIYDLRPPALDELGLVGAIARQVESYRSRPGAPEVELDGPGAPIVLSPAVEVAAYRIVAEALTNVVRHAEAETCRVRLACDGRLELEVADDGRGLPTPVVGGVGLRSMGQRAAEVGGECSVAPRSGGGTVVQAWLPIDRG